MLFKYPNIGSIVVLIIISIIIHVIITKIVRRYFKFLKILSLLQRKILCYLPRVVGGERFLRILYQLLIQTLREMKFLRERIQFFFCDVKQTNLV
jgi:hypothetical protein